MDEDFYKWRERLFLEKEPMPNWERAKRFSELVESKDFQKEMEALFSNIKLKQQRSENEEV